LAPQALLLLLLLLLLLGGTIPGTRESPSSSVVPLERAAFLAANLASLLALLGLPRLRGSRRFVRRVCPTETEGGARSERRGLGKAHTRSAFIQPQERFPQPIRLSHLDGQGEHLSWSSYTRARHQAHSTAQPKADPVLLATTRSTETIHLIGEADRLIKVVSLQSIDISRCQRPFVVQHLPRQNINRLRVGM